MIVTVTEASTVANASEQSCEQTFRYYRSPPGEIYCNWTWDSILCWPPTKAGTTAVQSCPKDRGVDPTQSAYKRCSIDGRWEGRKEGDYSSPKGWTNYTTCYTPETWELFQKLYSGSEENYVTRLGIAEKTRTLEMIGFSVSLAALLVSLAIFFKFRSLRNNRTKIHRNLFVAMVVQVIIRLTLYIDQFIIRANVGNLGLRQGIDNTPFLCEASYILLEYARTAMFMWMFVEGLYLHNMITVTVFHHEESYYVLYSLVGWGVPVLMTAVWAVVTAIYYKSSKCWWGYNLTSYFWILEGPRLGVVLFNFLFLLNIIRVLIVKLRQSRTSEVEQVKKAVRAALVLVPLLGITNIISMSKSPLEKTVWEFALWSYGTHFLTSFQGFFIAFLYCFLNGEVRTAVMKSLSNYFSQMQVRRTSFFSGVYDPGQNQVNHDSELTQGSVRDGKQRHRFLRKQRSQKEPSGLCWTRLCCNGNRLKPPDVPVTETRV